MVPDATRLLNPAERMNELFDRTSTLNFTIVARVRGGFDASDLERALRGLEARHPLLRAAITRQGGRVAFAPGRAAPIPLRVEQGPDDAWEALTAATLDHRVWPDDGPRAELIWLRHEAERSTLILLLHHAVSDGSSGIFAMRDLLALLGDPSLAREPVPSPGQHVYYPAKHGGLRTTLRALAMVGRSMRKAKPKRLRETRSAPIESRRVHLRRVHVQPELAQAIVQRARRDGATVHGVLCAALAQAIAEHLPAPMPARILHPVDLRRYLRSLSPDAAPIAEAVGYYVSSVDTDHRVDPSAALGPLAAEITRGVRAKKAAGEPLLNAPVAGPMLAKRGEKMAIESFRTLLEKQVFIGTFGISNLGSLESLGVRRELGGVHVDDLWFAAANSVFGALGGSATSFGGALSLQLVAVEPFVTRALAAQLATSTEQRLVRYASQA